MRRAGATARFGTRDLLNEVARIAQTSSERTSFTRALYVARRSVITPCGFSPSARNHDRLLGLAEIRWILLPRRRSRDCPRKLKSSITPFSSKAPDEPASHRCWRARRRRRPASRDAVRAAVERIADKTVPAVGSASDPRLPHVLVLQLVT